MELRGPRIWNGRDLSGIAVERLLNSVLDAGVNFLDTASVYGQSEELIGRCISHRRSEFIIATKGGWAVERFDRSCDITPHVWTRKNLFESLEQSLRRLRTDYVDLLQLHNPSPEECEHGELLTAIEDLRRQGKIRWLGISTKVPYLADFLSYRMFHAFQVPYSALRRTHENWLRLLFARRVGTIVRGGLAQGEPGFGMGSPTLWQKYDEANLDDFRSPDDTKSTFLLRFVLSNVAVDTVIVGTLDATHLAQNVRITLKGPLSADTYVEVLRRLDALGPPPDPVVCVTRRLKSARQFGKSAGPRG